MLVKELYQKLEQWYPKELRCEWDHDGVMCLPQEKQEVASVLVALDVTDRVLSYAIEHHFDVIVTHHPMFFSPLTSFDVSDPLCRRLLLAIEHGISIFSFHTRMDAACQGVNDALAQVLSLENVTALDGLARVGELPQPMEWEEFLSHVKRTLSIEFCRYTCGDSQKKICRVAVCGGSGKDYLNAALDAGADAFVTGELSYHTMLDAQSLPMALLACGHSDTELPICNSLQKRLQAAFPSLCVQAFIEKHTF